MLQEVQCGSICWGKCHSCCKKWRGNVNVKPDSVFKLQLPSLQSSQTQEFKVTSGMYSHMLSSLPRLHSDMYSDMLGSLPEVMCVVTCLVPSPEVICVVTCLIPSRGYCAPSEMVSHGFVSRGQATCRLYL